MIRAAFWVCGSGIVCVLLGYLLFGSAGHDDSHITYWAAWSLSEHGELFNYNGERVEQSSSLGLVLVLAVAAALLPFASIPTLGWIVGLAFGAASIHQASRLATLMDRRTGFLTAPVVATSASFVYWSTSGTEGTLMAFASLWFLSEAAMTLEHLGRSRLIRLGIAILLLELTRPEAGLLAACVALSGLVIALVDLRRLPIASERAKLRGSLALAGLVVSVGLLILVFRLGYFGDPLPNAALAKGGTLRGGLLYLFQATLRNNPLWLLTTLAAWIVAIALMITHRRGSTAFVLSASFLFAYCCFVVGSGGDWMTGGRFLAPALPVAAALAITLLHFTRFSPEWARSMAGILVLTNLYFTIDLARSSNTGRPAILGTGLNEPMLGELSNTGGFSHAELLNKSHLQNAIMIGPLLRILEQLEPTPNLPLHIMSGQAGMVPYYVFQPFFGSLRFIDAYSLTTSVFRHCLSKKQARRTIHGIYIPYKTYLEEPSRIRTPCGLPKPDIIFSNRYGPVFQDVLPANGYVVVYQQTTTLDARRSLSWLSSSTHLTAFIAVRRELVERHGLRSTHLRDLD
jgi:hypothetical protein